jgi:hypothetical protein
MQSDWKELIASLKSHGVEFLVVGAHALALYATKKATARPKDIADLTILSEVTGETY